MFQAGEPHRRLVYAWEGEVEGLRAEIERLRTENDKLRWHLETILQAADEPSCGWYSIGQMTVDDVREAYKALSA
jgi:hypothetical protein